MTWDGWERQLLGALGLEATPARVAFLAAWAACEGGHAAWNPLNTTMSLSGDHDYNRAGVKIYADALQGLAATILTLRLPYYRRLRVALSRNDLTAQGILRAGSGDVRTWGTNPDCIAARLR